MLHRLVATSLLILSLGVLAGADFSCPNTILADESGVPLEGVPKSISELSAVEKVLNLPFATYKAIRPDCTFKTWPDSPIVEPEPEPPVVTPIGELGVVYSRTPRTTGEITAVVKDGSSITSSHWDLMDRMPDIWKQFEGFNAPGQAVWKKPGGSEVVIYDCMDAARPCVPVDMAVSPDGKRVAFAVMSADSLVHTHPANQKYPPMVLGSVGRQSHIAIYTLATGDLVEWPQTEGVNDSGPAWLPDGRIMFTSTRDGWVVPYRFRVNESTNNQPRLYTANREGGEVLDISPHELTAALHPFVHSTGRVFYSSEWWSHNLTYGTANGGVNFPGTSTNQWSIVATDHTGGDYTAALGAHNNGLNSNNSFDRGIIALHFLGERSNQDLCVANYYRANKLGLGNIPCWAYTHPLEGQPPKFVPDDMYTLTQWAWPQDRPSIKDENGIYQGSVGYPEGIPGSDQMLLTHGDGICTHAISVVKDTLEMLEETGNKGCDLGIKKTSVIPSAHPSDLVVVADSPEWHEFGARFVVARPKPTLAVRENNDGACTLASSDAGSTDSYHYSDYEFNKEYERVDNNGALMEAVDHSELAGVRFYEQVPNVKGADDPINFIGNKQRLLGDVGLLDDKSFKVELPCNVPYTMAGIDKDNRIIKRDQIAQSLRTGEARVCEGCHLHSERGRPYEQSLAYTAPAIKLLEAIAVPTYTEDVLPIFEDKCSSCHTQDDVPLYVYEELVTDYSQIYVREDRRMVLDPNPALDESSGWGWRHKYGFHRPLGSKYVSTMYCRESQLYWKAKNERTDGRADDLYNNDIDFGADHPTTMTAPELETLCGWIDAGSAK